MLAVLLALTALVTIASAGKMLWDALSRWSLPAQTLRVLNELLVVLMLVEILHTVRDFDSLAQADDRRAILVVGLNCFSIRRMLVITLEAATLSREGAWVSEGARAIFHGSMMSWIAGAAGLILVHSIIWLRPTLTRG